MATINCKANFEKFYQTKTLIQKKNECYFFNNHVYKPEQYHAYPISLFVYDLVDIP